MLPWMFGWVAKTLLLFVERFSMGMNAYYAATEDEEGNPLWSSGHRLYKEPQRPLIDRDSKDYRRGNCVSTIAETAVYRKLVLDDYVENRYVAPGEIRKTCPNCGARAIISVESLKKHCICNCGETIHGEEGWPIAYEE